MLCVCVCHGRHGFKQGIYGTQTEHTNSAHKGHISSKSELFYRGSHVLLTMMWSCAFPSEQSRIVICVSINRKVAQIEIARRKKPLKAFVLVWCGSLAKSKFYTFINYKYFLGITWVMWSRAGCYYQRNDEDDTGSSRKMMV